jgi:hypothetical protein
LTSLDYHALQENRDDLLLCGARWRLFCNDRYARAVTIAGVFPHVEYPLKNGGSGLRMKWITKEKVKVDRVACPWLIKNFIDPQAEFLFVERDRVLETAARENAVPYDMPGVELGHRQGRCSFETFLEKYGLDDPALILLGQIIHDADVSTDLYGKPEAAGLKAIAEGFGALGFSNDLELNRAEWIVYDALYQYCKVTVTRKVTG